MTNADWKEIEKYANMEYPRIGEPLLAPTMTGRDEHTFRYMPHIITAKGQGFFLNYWVATEVRCWEISRDKVIQMRKELANKGKL